MYSGQRGCPPVAVIRTALNNGRMPGARETDAQRFLAHHSLRMAGHGAAADYARLLLESLGAQVTSEPGEADPDPASAWAHSGLMSLTGFADGPAQMCPAPLASCADGAIKALACLASPALRAGLPSGSALLGERAAIMGLRRNGYCAPGGSCRLLRASDTWLAVNLAREADWSAASAWLADESIRCWDDVSAAVRMQGAETLLERARLLGLPVSRCEPTIQAAPWCQVNRTGLPAPFSDLARAPLVVDLSSLWAGPLCSHLLQRLGAHVVKVETRARPDGARRGSEKFYDLLNHGKRSVALDFDDRGIAHLRALLTRADIVIEASRPRALRQLGIIAERWVDSRPGLTWISITGHGREEPFGSWVAFGDDAAVAAGLSTLMLNATGSPVICGDAIADPLTGIHAALAAWSSYLSGGGRLLSLSLRDVVSHCASFHLPDDNLRLRQRWRTWTKRARDAGLDETAPRARLQTGRARPLGADSDAVLAELTAAV